MSSSFCIQLKKSLPTPPIMKIFSCVLWKQFILPVTFRYPSKITYDPSEISLYIWCEEGVKILSIHMQIFIWFIYSKDPIFPIA